ncbi:MAG: sulfurtransferase TusA family protein [Nitrososphaerota archaeon]
MNIQRRTADNLSLQADTVLEMTEVPATEGAMCALLTPAIKAKLRDMAPGQVLEVRVNDPTARDDIVSWCRLSGNELIALTEESSHLLRVYLRKKQG